MSEEGIEKMGESLGSAKLSMKQFSQRFPLHSPKSFVSYTIYRDLIMKNEVRDIKVMDGSCYGFDTYLFLGTLRGSEKTRLHIPCLLDEDIDLCRLSEVVGDYEKTGNEVFVCISNYENIIYQIVSSALP